MHLLGVDICIEALESPATTVTPSTVKLVVHALRMCKDSWEQVRFAGLRDDPDLNHAFDSLNHATDSLREYLAERPVAEEKLLEWARGTVEFLEEVILDLQKKIIGGAGSDRARKSILALGLELGSSRNLIATELQNHIIRREAAELVQETRAARDAAQSAAGLAGSASLGTYFSGYAKQEQRASNVFRWLTTFSVLGGAAGVFLAGHFDAGDWYAVSTRLAIAGTSAALGTYFARQAGQHRRLFNWARSTQVQLDSFPAFIAPMPEAEQSEAYRTLSRRVLSAPPEKAAEAEDSIGSAQLVDLVLALAKRGS